MVLNRLNILFVNKPLDLLSVINQQMGLRLDQLIMEEVTYFYEVHLLLELVEYFFPNSYIDTTGKGRITFTGDAYFCVEDVEVFLPVEN